MVLPVRCRGLSSGFVNSPDDVVDRLTLFLDFFLNRGTTDP
jgi:hypothetical protein